MGKQVHVYRSGRKAIWNIKASGIETQEEAAELGRKISQAIGGELLISGEDGQFREKDSHGNDPRNIPG